MPARPEALRDFSRAPRGAPRAAAEIGSPFQSSRSNAMNVAGISAASLRTRDSAGWSRVCIESKSSTPSREITISPSSAEWGGAGRRAGAARGSSAAAAGRSRPERELAAVVLEHAAEAVPLRLVLPAVAGRELADELRLHRRERDVRPGHSRKPSRVANLDGIWTVERVPAARCRRSWGCGSGSTARAARRSGAAADAVPRRGTTLRYDAPVRSLVDVLEPDGRRLARPRDGRRRTVETFGRSA